MVDEPDPQRVVVAKPPKPVSEMTDEERLAFAAEIVDALGVFPLDGTAEH